MFLTRLIDIHIEGVCWLFLANLIGVDSHIRPSSLIKLVCLVQNLWLFNFTILVLDLGCLGQICRKFSEFSLVLLG